MVARLRPPSTPPLRPQPSFSFGRNPSMNAQVASVFTVRQGTALSPRGGYLRWRQVRQSCHPPLARRDRPHPSGRARSMARHRRASECRRSRLMPVSAQPRHCCRANTRRATRQCQSHSMPPGRFDICVIFLRSGNHRRSRRGGTSPRRGHIACSSGAGSGSCPSACP